MPEVLIRWNSSSQDAAEAENLSSEPGSGRKASRAQTQELRFCLKDSVTLVGG